MIIGTTEKKKKSIFIFAQHKNSVICLLLCECEVKAGDGSRLKEKVRKTDSVFVHSSGVHAYFSDIWVFVCFALLGASVKAVLLDFLAF